jgi:hypothetical protein
MKKRKMTKAEREEMEARHARIDARNQWLRDHIAKRREREGRHEQQPS